METNWTLPIIPVDSTLPDLDINTALNGLYNLANLIIASMFGNFTELSSYINDVLTAEDPLTYFSETWEDVVNLEIGLIVALSFGALYIVAMIFYGIIFSILRCCCNLCGHTNYMSMQENKSKWKYVNSFTLILICTSLIICMIFIYLTNDWTNRIITDLSTDITIIFNNLSLYVTGIASQISYYTDNLDKLGEETITFVDNVQERTITPIIDDIIGRIKPILEESQSVPGNIDGLVNKMNSFDSYLGNLLLRG